MHAPSTTRWGLLLVGLNTLIFVLLGLGLCGAGGGAVRDVRGELQKLSDTRCRRRTPPSPPKRHVHTHTLMHMLMHVPFSLLLLLVTSSYVLLRPLTSHCGPSA